MSELNMGTLYDFNKSVMKTMPLPRWEETENQLEEVKKWILTTDDEDEELPIYYMLLNNELHDYTVFRIPRNENIERKAEEMKADILDCLQNRWFEILSIDKENAWTYEIWVRRENDAIPFEDIDKGEKQAVYCYHLFPYDGGVIEYD